jgi:hypothetical protein
MKATAASLVVRALEEEGATFTFGIPGTHNIELYDALDRSVLITPVLITDEQAGSFMADGVSRSTGGVGVLNVVPGAGVTHALSGIAERSWIGAACGADLRIRTDTGKHSAPRLDQLPCSPRDQGGAGGPSGLTRSHRALRRASLARAARRTCGGRDPGQLLHAPARGRRRRVRRGAAEVPQATAAQLDEAAALLGAAKHPLITPAWLPGRRGPLSPPRH